MLHFFVFPWQGCLHDGIVQINLHSFTNVCVLCYVTHEIKLSQLWCNQLIMTLMFVCVFDSSIWTDLGEFLSAIFDVAKQLNAMKLTSPEKALLQALVVIASGEISVGYKTHRAGSSALGLTSG